MLESIKNIFSSSDKKFIEILKKIEKPTDIKIERVRQTWDDEGKEGGLRYANPIDDEALKKGINASYKDQFNNNMDMPAVRKYIEKLMSLYLFDNKHKTSRDFVKVMKEIGIKLDSFPSLVEYSGEDISGIIDKNYKVVTKNFEDIKDICDSVSLNAASMKASFDNLRKAKTRKIKPEDGTPAKVDKNKGIYDIDDYIMVSRNCHDVFKVIIDESVIKLKKLSSDVLNSMGTFYKQLEKVQLTRKSLGKSRRISNREAVVNEITKLLNDEYKRAEQEYINKHKKEFELCVKYSKPPYFESLKQTIAEWKKKKGPNSDDLQRAQIGVTVFLGVAIDVENQKYQNALNKIVECFY